MDPETKFPINTTLTPPVERINWDRVVWEKLTPEEVTTLRTRAARLSAWDYHMFTCGYEAHTKHQH